MKSLGIFGSCLCFVYLLFALILREINPDAWPAFAWYMAGIIWGALSAICIVIQAGLDADQRETDKYFNDNSNERKNL